MFSRQDVHDMLSQACLLLTGRNKVRCDRSDALAILNTLENLCGAHDIRPAFYKRILLINCEAYPIAHMQQVSLRTAIVGIFAQMRRCVQDLDPPDKDTIAKHCVAVEMTLAKDGHDNDISFYSRNIKPADIQSVCERFVDSSTYDHTAAITTSVCTHVRQYLLQTTDNDGEDDHQQLLIKEICDLCVMLYYTMKLIASPEVPLIGRRTQVYSSTLPANCKKAEEGRNDVTEDQQVIQIATEKCQEFIIPLRDLTTDLVFRCRDKKFLDSSFYMIVDVLIGYDYLQMPLETQFTRASQCVARDPGNAILQFARGLEALDLLQLFRHSQFRHKLTANFESPVNVMRLVQDGVDAMVSAAAQGHVSASCMLWTDFLAPTPRFFFPSLVYAHIDRLVSANVPLHVPFDDPMDPCEPRWVRAAKCMN